MLVCVATHKLCFHTSHTLQSGITLFITVLFNLAHVHMSQPLSHSVEVNPYNFQRAAFAQHTRKTRSRCFSPVVSYIWSQWWDSNPRPDDYKSPALPSELHGHIMRPRICTLDDRRYPFIHHNISFFTWS